MAKKKSTPKKKTATQGATPTPRPSGPATPPQTKYWDSTLRPKY